MSAPQEYVEVFKPTSGRFLGVVGLLVCAGVVVIALVDPGSGIGVTGVAVAVLVGALVQLGLVVGAGLVAVLSLLLG